MTLKDLVLPSFEDPEVQIVYETICGMEPPPNPEEHWEGWLARHIVCELRRAAVSSGERK
jgi:hypothetical protein